MMTDEKDPYYPSSKAVETYIGGEMTFEQWWKEIGSAIPPFHWEDHEEFARRICLVAWNDAHGAQQSLSRVRLAGLLDDLLQLASPVNKYYHVKMDANLINEVIDVYCDLVLDMTDEEIIEHSENKHGSSGEVTLGSAKVQRIIQESLGKYRQRKR